MFCYVAHNRSEIYRFCGARRQSTGILLPFGFGKFSMSNQKTDLMYQRRTPRSSFPSVSFCSDQKRFRVEVQLSSLDFLREVAT